MSHCSKPPIKKVTTAIIKTHCISTEMVLMKEELIVRYQKQMAKLETFLAQPFVPRIGRTRSGYDKVHRAKQIEYNNRKDGLKKIQEAEAYDMDLSLRIARCYVGLKRNVPAYTLYRKMIAESPEHELAEDARYNAFSVAVDMFTERAGRRCKGARNERDRIPSGSPVHRSG